MPVTARNPFELVPIGLGMVSAAMFFGLLEENGTIPSYIYDLFVPSLLSIPIALAAILFGFRFVKQNGRNAVVWVGVLGSMLLIAIEFLPLLYFYLWRNYGF